MPISSAIRPRALTDPYYVPRPRLEIAGIQIKIVGEMTDTVENLILDLLEWAGCKERTYRKRWMRGGHPAQGSPCVEPIPQFKAAKLGEFLEARFSQSF
jgi:hypothetical protein